MRGGRRSDGEVVEALVAEVDGESLAQRGRTHGAPTSGAEAEARGGGAWARDGGRCQRWGDRLVEDGGEGIEQALLDACVCVRRQEENEEERGDRSRAW